MTMRFFSRSRVGILVPTAILMLAVGSCGAQEPPGGKQRVKNQTPANVEQSITNQVAERQPELPPVVETNMLKVIRAEFEALKRPLVLGYERKPARWPDTPTKSGLLIPPTVRAVVTDETIAFIKKHSTRDLVDGLMPIMNDPQSDHPADACVVLTVTLGNDADKLAATEYRSPTTNGKWASLGPAAVGEVKRLWNWKSQIGRPTVKTNDASRALGSTNAAHDAK